VTSSQLQRFRAVSELQYSLEDKITKLKENSDKLAIIIGDKLRATDNANSSDVQDLKEKIEGGANNPKKKKVVTKKGQKSIWYNLEAISIYEGMGLKGELELYFKDLEETKKELERVTKVKQAIDNLSSNGLKKEFGCVMMLGHELPAEIAFFRTHDTRKKFSFKSIFNVPKDDYNEL
jgi:hypothetical protein